MIKKRCLLIDDEDQKNDIERFVAIGQRNGLDIDCTQFQVGGQKRRDLFDGGSLNKERVFDAFKAEYKGRYDLIAFDYDLQDEGGLTGIDLIRLLGPEKKTATKVVYSGMIDTVLADILNKYAKDGDLRSAKSSLVTVFTQGITDYLDRVSRAGKNYEVALVEILLRKEPSTERLFVKKMEEYGDFKFNTLFPPYKGKTMKEIAEQMDKTSDNTATNFRSELIEYTIANMIELNKK